MRTAWSLAPVIVAASSLMACTSARLTTHGPFPSQEEAAKQAGVRYYLPKSQLRVTARVTERVERSVVVGELDGRPHLCLKTAQRTKVAGTTALASVADASHAFVVDMDPGSGSDASLTVEVTEAGLLRSINAASVGKVGENLVALARFGGSFAGLVSGLVGAAAGQAEPPPVCRWDLTKPGACDVRQGEYLWLPLPVRAFIRSEPAGCALHGEIAQAEASVGEQEDRIEKVQQELVGADQATTRVLLRKLDALRLELLRRQSHLQLLRDRFSTLLAAFLAGEEIGKEETPRDLAASFDLADLPLHDGRIAAGKSSDQVRSELDTLGKTRALAYFREAATVVTFERLAGAPPAQQTPDCGGTRTGVARIYYRQAEPYHLRVFVMEREKLKLDQELFVDLVHPRAPAGCFAFEPSAFAARKLALTFDGLGRPIKLERETKASDLAKSLADAAKGARDEFAGSLSKLVEIDESRRKLKTADLVTELEEVKKRKEIVDAQLGLESARTNYQLLLDQQRLAAELAHLRTELELAGATDNAERAAEIARMKLELERQGQEIEAVKKRLELEALLKSGNR